MGELHSSSGVSAAIDSCEMDENIIYGDSVVVEADIDEGTSGVLHAESSLVDILPLCADDTETPEQAEWLILSAEGEQDQTCQPIEFGENVRLYHGYSGQRLHFDGAEFSLWAAADGSGDTNDNWCVLSGTGKGDGSDWIVGEPFMLRHCATGMVLGGDARLVDPTADPP